MPLFEPPLSMDDIQNAGSAGLAGVAGFTADAVPGTGPTAEELLMTAKGLAETVVGFGGTLLRALESKSAEDLAILQVDQQVHSPNNSARSVAPKSTMPRPLRLR